MTDEQVDKLAHEWCVRQPPEVIRDLHEHITVLDAFKAGYAASRPELAALQAEIDALMLEYCPAEMTDEQRKEWAANQVRATGAPKE